MTTAVDVIALVEAGDADDDLESLFNAVRARRAYVAQQRITRLKAGDAVRFNGTLKPTYLRGLYATFVRRDRGKVVVKINEQTPTGTPQDRRRYTGEVRAEPDMLVVE